MTTITTGTLEAPKIDTPKGEIVIVSIHVGYIPHQNRPMDCKTWGPDPNHPKRYYTSGCKHADKRCDGHTVLMTGVYQGTIHYMDNSIEGTVLLDEPVNGKNYHIVQFTAPHGDICF